QSSHGLDNAQGYGAQYDSAYISQAANGAYPKHQLSMPSLGSYRGGSLPNVNQMSGGQGHSIDLQGALHHLEDMRHGREMALPPAGPDRPHGTRERGRHATAPHKSRQAAFDKRVDVSPYSSSLYLSPPPDSSWRRTNSDSALHQSAQSSGGQQDAFAGVGSSGQRRGTALQDVNSFAMDIMHLKGYWDPKGGGGGDCFGNSMQDMGCQHRPKSCEVPGINTPLPGSLHMPAGPNMGNGNTGSLPDLTSLHFPPPLATPLDPSEELGGQQQHPGGGMAPMHSSTYARGPQTATQRLFAMTFTPSGRRGSPGPAPSPSSRRRAHHSSTSVVLGGGRHHGSPGQGQVRVSSPHQHHHHQRPHLPRITVEGLTMDTNALSLEGYGVHQRTHGCTLQTPTSPRPRQLYQGGAPSERSGSAPGSPVSHGASSSPTSPPGPVGSPYGGGNGYGRAGSAMGSTSPLQQQMEQFRV
ncbi:unnamed protein product, partial [Ixodes pacificus]